MTEKTEPVSQLALQKQLKKEVTSLSLRVKELEHFLKKSQDSLAYFKQAFSQSPYPCMLMESVYGVPTRFIEINESAVSLWGVSKPDFIQKDPLDIFAKGEKKKFFQYAETLLIDGVTSFEANITTSNKNSQKFEFKYIVLSDEKNPDLLGFALPVQTSDLKKYSDDTVEFDNTPLEYVYKMDVRPDLKLHYVSNSVELITGFSVEEMMNAPHLFLESLHPLDRQEYINFVRHTDNKYRPWVGRFLRKDETVIWIENYLHVTSDADGNVLTLAGVVHDITARMQKERRDNKALQVEKLLSSLLKSALKKENLDKYLQQIVRKVNSFLETDRAFLIHKDQSKTHIIYSRNKNIILINDLEDAELKRLLSGKALTEDVYYIKNADELPEQYEGLKAYIERNNIRSMLGVPVRKNGEVLGLIGVEMVSKRVVWDRVDIYLLENMAQIIALQI